MNFTHFPLGHCERGAVVEVTLRGNAANVRLMDSSNFNSYKNGRQHRYIGGLMQRSPTRLQIPNSGQWHVAVDFQGLAGRANVGVRVLPPELLQPLPPIQEQASSLASIAATAATTPSADTGREFDVFISHAHEDKDAIVRPLAHALQAEGLEVWYDEFELSIGDSLRRKIDAGLARSRFGVVVLSQAFFAKNWPQYELDGLVTREMTGEQVILPLWHGISKDEVIAQSPSLADKVALRTADYSVAEIAQQIADVVKSRSS